MMHSIKALGRAALSPLREPVTWACQRGYLPSSVRKILPWRWVLEPFRIYGFGHTFLWHPTEFDSLGHLVFWEGIRRWESETVPVMLNELRAARCFMDIGANCGIYTVLGCLSNRSLHVIAVEPTDGPISALRRNAALNGVAERTTALQIAVGSQSGRVSFFRAEDATMSSLGTSGYQGQRGEVIEVECCTLDELVSQLNVVPDLLKIDVEGHEHEVLSGASDVLKRMRPRIILEANPGDRSDLVSDILESSGYTFSILTDRGAERRPRVEADQRFRNWLCTPTQSVSFPSSGTVAS